MQSGLTTIKVINIEANGNYDTLPCKPSFSEKIKKSSSSEQ